MVARLTMTHAPSCDAPATKNGESCNFSEDGCFQIRFFLPRCQCMHWNLFLTEAQEVDLNDLPTSWLGWIMSHHRNLQAIEGFRPQPQWKLRALQN